MEREICLLHKSFPCPFMKPRLARGLLIHHRRNGTWCGGGYLHDGELRLILVLFRKFNRGGSDELGAYSTSKKCLQDIAKKPCARVANKKTETKMDDIKVARPQCLKNWLSIVVNEECIS
jgi:hypothetical protein